MLDPLHQFEIHKIFDLSIAGIDISFTNSSLLMVLITLSICSLLYLCTKGKDIVPNKMQSIGEMLFGFISNMITDQTGKEGLKYMPYIFSLFIFILFSNLFGLIPYSFTVTSHIIVTFSLAMFVFVGMTFAGIAKHGFKFFKVFLPSGVPGFIAPLMIPVEIISYLSRPLSLSVRLFANMVAGHVILKIVAGAAAICAVNSVIILSVFPVGVNVILTVFELFIAVLQAYVFTILSCIYLNSVLHLH